jgi:HAD superfamily hydrolase (TIGR01509 family)
MIFEYSVVPTRAVDFFEDPMPLEALIFDVDGTLAETEEVHRQAFNGAFAAFGLAWKWERPLYKELLQVTGGKERILHYLTNWHARELASVREKIPKIYDFKTKRYTAMILAGAVELNPGVARLIGEAKAAGARLAIATTTHRDNVEALLHHTLPAHGTSLFDAIVAGDEVSAKKPDPEVFEAALRKLRLPVASCVAFEDSANGANAARGAGLPVVVTPGIYTADDDFSGASSVVSDLGEPGRPLRHLAGWEWPDGYVSYASLRTKNEESPAPRRSR